MLTPEGEKSEAFVIFHFPFSICHLEEGAGPNSK